MVTKVTSKHTGKLLRLAELVKLLRQLPVTPLIVGTVLLGPNHVGLRQPRLDIPLIRQILSNSMQGEKSLARFKPVPDIKTFYQNL